MGMTVEKKIKASSTPIDFFNPEGFLKMRDIGISINGDSKNNCMRADKNHVCGKHYKIV